MRNTGFIFKTRVSYYLNKFNSKELKVVLDIGKELLKEKIKKENTRYVGHRGWGK